MRHILSIVFCLFLFSSFSQGDTDQQLAQHYYTNGEFDKALTYYEPDLRPALKECGYLTRDSRVVERKKYGHPFKKRTP